MLYIILVAAMLLSALDGTPARAGDWPTFGGTAARTSNVTDETTLSPSAVPALVRHWSLHLPGEAAAQPAFLAAVNFGTATHDEVFVGTRTGALLAVDATTGTIDWQTMLPAPAIGCRSSRPNQYGISSTPTIDRNRGLIYTVTADGNLHALAITTGAEATGFPLPVIDAPNLQAGTFNHASPLEIGNTLYITTSASCESPHLGNHGQIIAVDLDAVSVVNRFYPVGNGSVGGGGIWGPGGVSAEADGSVLYGATANADGAASTTGLGEHVIALDANLNLLAANLPPLPSLPDIDFGTTPVLMDVANCPPLLAVINKSGLLFIYDRTAIANGPLQSLQISTGDASSDFIGAPSFDATAATLVVANPVSSTDGSFPHGVVALQVNSACQLTPLWSQTAGTGISAGSNRAKTPIVADGVVWLSTGAGRELAAFDEILGTPLWSSGTLGLTGTTGQPLVENGQVFVVLSNLRHTTLFAYGL